MTEHSAEVVEALETTIRRHWVYRVPAQEASALAHDCLSALSAAGYEVAPIGSERAAGFAAGVRAGLEAAVAVVDKGVRAYIELIAQEQSASERQHYLSGKSEAEMLARTIRAIDPASAKDTSDA